jgi:hypothetical protein
MKTALLLTAVMLVSCPALADQPDPIAAACSGGVPWLLPRSQGSDPAKEARQNIILNASTSVRVTICNCTPNRQAQSRVLVNAYHAAPATLKSPSRPRVKGGDGHDLPDPNEASYLYAGSCLDAGGRGIQITNPSATDPANGSYYVR